MKGNGYTQGRFPLTPIAAAVALMLAAPAALAEPMFEIPWFRGAADMSRYDENNVELGVGYNTENSYKFGEFTGLYDQGAFLIGNFNVRKRVGENTAGYVNASGWNLGLPSRQIDAIGGQQGRYWLTAGYQEIPRYQYDDTQFIHRGLGGNTLTLPPGFAGITAGTSQPPANINAIAPYLTEYDIKQDRDIWKLGGGINIGPNTTLSVNYRQDDRDGSRLIGAVMGNSGGNPRAAILPYDLNDTTKQIEAVINWTGTQGSATLSYWYSKYEQNDGALTWQNPYGGIAGWGVGPGFSGTGFPTGYGRMGLMPSNDYWQIQATGGWNFTRDTRMTASYAYGVAKQNEEFLPYTINGPAAPGLPTQTPGTSLAVNTALPSSSLNGEIVNQMFDLGVSSRIMPKLTVRAKYHFYERDNKTPEQWYSYIGGDTTNQTLIAPGVDPETINSSRVRRNLAPGTKENRVKLDGDYEIWRRTLLRLWYQYQQIDYSVASEELRADTTNNQYAGELRHYASENFTGALRYQYDQRRGADFSQLRPYQASYTTATIAATVPPFDNLTTLRQYYVADYDQDLVRALGTFTPMDTVAISLSADWYKRNYKGPDCGGPNDQVAAVTIPSDCLGLQQAQGQSYTIDASWTPMEGFSAFAFYTYGVLENQQDSRSWGGANTNYANPARDWTADLKNVDNTFGAGVKFTAPDRKYDVGLQYLYNQGTAKTTVSGPVVPATAAAVPNAESTLNSIQLFGTWRYTKNLAFRANYWYQKLDSTDWAYDNAAPWSSNNVLLTGQQAPNYSAHVFGISVAYTGW